MYSTKQLKEIQQTQPETEGLRVKIWRAIGVQLDKVVDHVWSKPGVWEINIQSREEQLQEHWGHLEGKTVNAQELRAWNFSNHEHIETVLEEYGVDPAVAEAIDFRIGPYVSSEKLGQWADSNAS